MIWFLDSEFNGFGGELLSLALVRQDADLTGRHSLSLVFPHPEAIHPWVAENVIPHQMSDPVSKKVERKDAASEIARLLRLDPDPVIVADWPEDISHFCDCLVVAPGQMIALPNLAFRIINAPKFPDLVEGAIAHNPWWDAMVLRASLMPS